MSETVESSGLRSVNLKPWLTSPWTVSVGALLAVVIFDHARSGEIAAIAIKAFAGTLPYITIAVLLIAWLKAAGAEAMIAEAFKGRENRAIILAALFGGLAPFCSCEVIPFIAGLLAVGAPLPAIMAFWLSSPLIDPPTLLITAGALGWPFAIAKAVAAVGLGLFGGFAVRALMRGGAFAAPAGGVCCSIEDLARFARAQLRCLEVYYCIMRAESHCCQHEPGDGAHVAYASGWIDEDLPVGFTRNWHN